MARVLLAWELGANLGHIDRLLVLAGALRERGHALSFVLRDLSRVQPRLVTQGYTVGQAPVWLPRLANPPRLGNYSAVLASAGWLDATGLAGTQRDGKAYRMLKAPATRRADPALALFAQAA